DARLVLIYVAALLSAFIGAKLTYLFAEGWLDWPMPDRWLRLATGKSVLGALLGGYAGVEAAKFALGYRAPTGDLFALVAPLGIGIGRIGCLLHGCCLGERCAPTFPAWFTLRDAQGVARWPAVPMELAFNVLALAAFLILRRRGILRGQHFHLYLIAYGLFRFAHEWMRVTPKFFGILSGYQFAALACTALGAWGFRRRTRSRVAPPRG
ncbi:MAG: prolipoprotein diacylglyceryl transferase family protein, partial [Chthoniobacteraceae bacterium]